MYIRCLYIIVCKFSRIGSYMYSRKSRKLADCENNPIYNITAPLAVIPMLSVEHAIHNHVTWTIMNPLCSILYVPLLPWRYCWSPCSVMVQLGPRDFWSQRMSEFTGRSHRAVFDGTLEKIYGRIYEQAQNTPWPLTPSQPPCHIIALSLPLHLIQTLTLSHCPLSTLIPSHRQ